MKKFRSLFALLMVFAFMMSSSLTVFAASHDVTDASGVEYAFNNDTDSDVVLNMQNDIDMGGTALTANEGQNYTFNGNGNTLSNVDVGGKGSVEVNADVGGLVAKEEVDVVVNGDVSGDNASGGNGVEAYDSANVTVNGDVSGGDTSSAYSSGGDGVEANDSANVTVNGDVSGGDASGEGASGGDGVEANDSANVTVNGDVSGGDASGDYSSGGDGVEANDSANVTVNGDAIGGSGSLSEEELQDPSNYSDAGEGVAANGTANVTVDGDAIGGDAMGTYAYAGNGVTVMENAKASITGDAIGGDVVADPDVAAEEDDVYTYSSAAGSGVAATAQATVTVGGSAVGGDTNGDKGTGGSGVILMMNDKDEEVGSVTVKGIVEGGDGEEPGAAVYYYGAADSFESLMDLFEKHPDNWTMEEQGFFAMNFNIIKDYLEENDPEKLERYGDEYSERRNELISGGATEEELLEFEISFHKRFIEENKQVLGECEYAQLTVGNISDKSGVLATDMFGNREAAEAYMLKHTVITGIDGQSGGATKTGDDSPIYLWAGMTGIGVIGAAAVLIAMRRKEQE